MRRKLNSLKFFAVRKMSLWYFRKRQIDSKLTLNISRNSHSWGKIQGIPIYAPRVRDTLISHVKTAGGESVEWILTRRHTSVTIWSISRARRGSFLWRWLRSGSCLPAILPLHYPAAPFVPSLFAADCPKGVRRGCFAMRRRRTAFRDTSVIIRRGCRNRVPARGRARERVSEIGKDASTWRTVARWRSRWGWKSVSRWN